MRPSRDEIQQEALSRAAYGQSCRNFGDIFAGFLAKGIPEADIRPRENVFTYHAWRALGRQVRRGEHGVRVITFVSIDREAPTDTQQDAKPARRGSRPWSATVFHISQTDAVK
jgi:N-terminal domain of anti-restriction factor ArdC